MVLGMCQSMRWTALYCYYRNFTHLGSYPLWQIIRTYAHQGRSIQLCMCVCEGDDRCWGGSWMGTFGGPCCLNMQPLLCSSIEAAVFNISAQLSPYLFRYSWHRGRDSERGVALLFPGSRAALLRFFGGQRDKAKKTETEGEGERQTRKRRSWNKKARLQSVLCWLDILCMRPALEAPGGHQGGGVWAQLSSLTWWLCPRQITNGAAVTMGLDQDKQPCFKISTCPLAAPFTSSTLRHIHISSHVQPYSLHRS